MEFILQPSRSSRFAAALRLAGTLAATSLTVLPAQAQGETPVETPQRLWEVGGVALGISQQAYPGSDQQVNRGLALPYFLYRGRVLRADRDTAGLRALRTERFELDLGVAGAFAARSQEITARQGMPDLGTLVEFGPRLKIQLGQHPGGAQWQLRLPLRGVFDLDQRAASRGLVFEPEIQFQRRSGGPWSYAVSLGAIVADQRLARTFYSVDPAFARPDRPVYTARAGLVAWRLAASTSREIGPDWRVFGYARLNTVQGAANQASPLVRQRGGASVGLGLAYTWLRSARPAQD